MSENASRIPIWTRHWSASFSYESLHIVSFFRVSFSEALLISRVKSWKNNNFKRNIFYLVFLLWTRLKAIFWKYFQKMFGNTQILAEKKMLFVIWIRLVNGKTSIELSKNQRRWKMLSRCQLNQDGKTNGTSGQNSLLKTERPAWHKAGRLAVCTQLYEAIVYRSDISWLQLLLPLDCDDDGQKPAAAELCYGVVFRPGSTLFLSFSALLLLGKTAFDLCHWKIQQSRRASARLVSTRQSQTSDV